MEIANDEEIEDCAVHLDTLALGDGENANCKQMDEDCIFDSIIGHIEDVLVDEEFQNLQKNFLEKYWKEFEDKDENKLCYTEIFKEYIDQIEKHIEDHLLKKIPNFSMQDFVKILQKRRTELDGEVFEVLYTFSDFLAFKEMFLDYKAFKDGTVQDLSEHISVTRSVYF